jgi:hypothetical protein
MLLTCSEYINDSKVIKIIELLIRVLKILKASDIRDFLRFTENSII